MTTRVIKSEQDKTLLCRYIMERKPPFTASITKKRTVDQNKLQRLWIGEIAEQLGDRTPEEVRGELKLRFGVPILRAQNDTFCEKYDRIIKPLPYEQKLELMMEPIDFPVSRIMTTAQFTQYIDEIYKFFTERGCVLTLPIPPAS